MKHLKKVMALAIAAIMIVAMAVPTMAATISMNKLEGHTYEIFQVFTGKVDDDGKTFTELKYGENAIGETGKFVGKDDLATLKSLEEKTDEHEIITEYSKFVDFDSQPITTVTTASASIDLAEGYYIIRDKKDDITISASDKAESDTTTLYMFQVLKDNLTISAKAGSVESKKKVDDINDTTKDESKLMDSADWEIGDTIPYTLTFKLPENYDKFQKYYVKFSDDMSKGLTLNAGSVEIQYGSGAKYPITFATDSAASAYDHGTVYAYEIADLKALTETEAKALKGGDVITITYTAYLNDDAVIGEAGNPNEYRVTFNNNPNKSGDGKNSPTGNTPWDVNIVFTYETVFEKVDENQTELTGADFTLEKLVDGAWVNVTTLGDTVHPKKIGTSAGSTFRFQGLDDGTYRLTEIVTPSGYNTIDPVYFTITASHELIADSPKLVSLDGVGTSDTAGKLTMTTSTGDGTLTTSIVNKSGAVLPSTGGIGTTIFYIVGAILAVGAGVLLITRRRMAQ